MKRMLQIFSVGFLITLLIFLIVATQEEYDKQFTTMVIGIFISLATVSIFASVLSTNKPESSTYRITYTLNSDIPVKDIISLVIRAREIDTARMQISFCSDSISRDILITHEVIDKNYSPVLRNISELMYLEMEALLDAKIDKIKQSKRTVKKETKNEEETTNSIATKI